MKLEKPIKISIDVLSELNYVKGKMLFVTSSAKFALLTSFEIKEQVDYTTVKKWFKKSFVKQEHNIYLTEIELWGYNTDGEFWGTFNEQNISTFLFFYSILKLRKNYERNIKLPLEKLGFEITKIKEDAQKEN
ncbi:MAG TPA: hypothetical protein DCQ93_04940 [Bacteroidetes bacterium]|nr:hypothetical protein [Bacteroidota bacterium]